MRILYIAPMPLPSRSANSVHAMKMCRAMAELGHDVTLLAESNEHHDTGYTVPESDIHAYYNVSAVFEIVLQQTVLKSRLLTAFALTWRALERGADIIHTRHVAAGLIIGLTGKSTMLELHQLPATRFKTWLLLLLARFLPGITGIVVNCGALKEHIAHKVPKLKSAIRVAHNGADAPPDTAPVQLAKPDCIHAGYSGQLFTGKGMEVIARLAPYHPDIVFDIVGGTESDIAFWRQQTADCPNIIYHGFQPQSRLPGYIAAFDIVLAPYQDIVHSYDHAQNIAQWTSPMKVFEYMAAGKPIIASDLPVLREVLEDRHNCFLCGAVAIDEWCKALDALKNDARQRHALGRQAQHDFLAFYTWQQRARELYGTAHNA